MKTVDLAPPAFPGDAYHFYGSARICILEGRYDPDQLWLTFGDEAVFFRHTEPDPEPIPHDARACALRITPKRIARKLSPPTDCLQPYRPRKGVEQYVLPIEKWQVPSKSLAKKIRANDYPVFERDEEGRVYELRYTAPLTGSLHSSVDVREWINRNCTGRVCLDTLAVFEKGDDALFAMVSGNFSKP